LEIEEIPLLLFILKALEGVERIGKICLAGPEKPIRELLHKYSRYLKNNKELAVIEQKENMYKNFWNAFIHTIDGYYEGMEMKDPGVREKLVLVAPCDLPLITSAEIDEFLNGCSVDDLDYCLGMTEERFLKKFYPDETRPGIKMAYLSLREGNFRLNNLHLVRPFRVYNREYIERIYECRYQKNIINIAKVVFDFFRFQGVGTRAIFFYAMLEVSVFLSYLGLSSLAQVTKNIVSQSEIRSFASKLLKTRIDIVQTTLGGSAVDIDNDIDFETIKTRFREWMEILEREERFVADNFFTNSGSGPR
jgi:hypothetical protein